MGEARSAAARYFNIPPGPDPELHNSELLEILFACRKSVCRYYYRTRNSIRNGTWPTSISNLVVAFLFILCLLLSDVEVLYTPKAFLWSFSSRPFFAFLVPQGLPRLLRAVLFASLLAVCFFIVLMGVRQQILRILLTYRGWMCELQKGGHSTPCTR